MRKMGAGEMARETGDTTSHERKASTSRLQSLCALRFFSTASLGSSGLAERRSEESAASSGGRAWLRAPPLVVCTLHSGACPRLCLGCCLRGSSALHPRACVR